MKEEVDTLQHCVCIDRPLGDDPSLEQFMAAHSNHPVPDLPDDPQRPVAIMGSGGHHR